MKSTLLLLALLPLFAQAQTSRISTLQNARGVTLSDGQRTVSRLVNGNGQNLVLYLKDGHVIAGSDTLDMKSTVMRLRSLPRFALDEDSTSFSGKYAVSYGLMALRMSLATGRWNTVTLPVALTGRQVLDTFGSDAQLAVYRSVANSGGAPTLEFETVSLDTDDTVVEAGRHYLLRPTREPDIAAGGKTSVVYGSGRVEGPLYAVAGVTLQKGLTVPGNQVLRSDDSQVRLRVRGTYDTRSITATGIPRYVAGDEGTFGRLSAATMVKGFRSWVEDASATASPSLRFYIDGIGEDIGTPTAVSEALQAPAAEGSVYSLSGQRVKTPAKGGLYIVGGRKVIIR